MERTTRDEWSRRVLRWRASGLTAREFASREELNAATLRWWSSRLGRDQRPAGKFVDVTALVPRAPDASLEVVVRGGMRIRVSRGFDAELLRAVVAALETR
jgi:hypothetical protein